MKTAQQVIDQMETWIAKTDVIINTKKSIMNAIHFYQKIYLTLLNKKLKKLTND